MYLTEPDCGERHVKGDFGRVESNCLVNLYRYVAISILHVSLSLINFKTLFQSLLQLLLIDLKFPSAYL